MQIVNNGLGVGLTGTTNQQHPELAGQVLRDESREFVFTDPVSGQQVASATVQDRVVRSNMGGRLHFYFRVREFHRSMPDLMLTVVARGPFVTPPLDVDFRLDGLGDVGPLSAMWAPSSTELLFSFLPPSPITPEKSSRFVFVQSNATEFADTGAISLGLSTPAMALGVVSSIVHGFAPIPIGGMVPPMGPAGG